MPHQKPKSVSIITPTFNRPEALICNLMGLRQQIDLPEGLKVEIVVADDGSGEPTRQLVETQKIDHPFQIKHAWHEDKGFRLAKIRNAALRMSEGEYIIFLDEDCVPSPDWLKNHLNLAEPGWFVAGNRILLNQDFTKLATADPKRQFMHYSAWDWFLAYLKGFSNRPFPHLRLPGVWWRRLRPTKWQVLKGCNMGIWREDLVAVNGFAEDMEGWGHEDAHFAVRLIRLGRRLKDGRFSVPVFHLWHKQNDRSKEEENRKKLQAMLNSDEIRVKAGLVYE